jgi:hypothetical protein
MHIRQWGCESPETRATNLPREGARHVVVEIMVDSGHWVAGEQPARVAALIARHAATRVPR